MKKDKNLLEELIKERYDLVVKYNKLALFIYSSEYYKLEESKRYLLRHQYNLMDGYISILEDRIDDIKRGNYEN